MYLLVNIWSGGATYLLPNTARVKTLIAEWQEMDKLYINEVISDDQWVSLPAYLQERGIELLDFERIRIY